MSETNVKAANAAPIKKQDSNESESKKDNRRGGNRQRRNKSTENKPNPRADYKPRYQAKLMVEENEEKKHVLIKITRNSGIRQIINFSLPRIKNEWVVEMNAFSMDITKVL